MFGATVTDDKPVGDLPEPAADQLAGEIRRRRRAAGLSQRELALRCGYTREYVSLAERPGGNIPSRELVRAVDNALDADGELLDLRSRAKFEQQSFREDVVAESSDNDRSDMPRRAFVLAGLTNGLFLQRGDAPGSVAEPLADQLQTVATVYRNAYSTVPAHQLYGAVHEHLNLVLSLRPGDQSPRVRKQLLTTTGEMAALAMPLLGLDLGRWSEAGQYLEIAFRAAREAENIDLETVVWACRAFHASYGTADLETGRDFADEAIATGRNGATATTRGWAAAVASERYADLGDSAASLQRLGLARTELDDVDARPWSGIGTFDGAKVLAYEGGNYGRLRRHQDAVRVLNIALDDLDSSMRRHRGTAFIDRAEAFAACGEVDAASADTRSALNLAMETQHSETIRRAKKLTRKMLSSGASIARQLWQEVLIAQAAMAMEG
jgi:transcriptional regulator with XRE-family HTH domain